MKKLQSSKEDRLTKEAETVRDQVVSLTSVLRSSVKQNKKITDEATRAAEQAVTTCVLEKERRLKHMHAKAIESKQSAITKVRKNAKRTFVKLKLVEKALKEDARVARKVATAQSRKSKSLKKNATASVEKLNYLRDALEAERDKASQLTREVENLRRNEERLTREMEDQQQHVEAKILQLEHDCNEATEELAVRYFVYSLIPVTWTIKILPAGLTDYILLFSITHIACKPNHHSEREEARRWSTMEQ